MLEKKPKIKKKKIIEPDGKPRDKSYIKSCN